MDDWLRLIEVLGGVAVPLVGGYIAYKLSRIQSQVQDRQWRNQAVIQKRLEIFDIVGPQLNTLFCYYRHVGDWKEQKPTDIIALKRRLDKTMHVYRHIFAADVFEQYLVFIQTCFDEHGEWGTDARIKSHFDRRVDTARFEWDSAWAAKFSPDLAADNQAIIAAYDGVMGALRGGLEIDERKQ